MSRILILLLACSSVALAGDGAGNGSNNGEHPRDPYANFNAAMAIIRGTTEQGGVTDLDCEQGLVKKAEDTPSATPSETPTETEPAVEFAKPSLPRGSSWPLETEISAHKENWVETVSRINASVEKLKMGQTLTIRDSDQVLNQVQWSQLLKFMGLRILGLRSFNGSNHVQILAQKVEPSQGVDLQPVDLTQRGGLSKFEVQYFKNRETGDLREILARTKRRILTFPYYINDGQLFVLARPESPGIPLTWDLPEVGGTGYFPQPIELALGRRDNGERKAVRLLKSLLPGQIGFRAQKSAAFFYPSPDSVLEGASSVFIPLKNPVTEAVNDWQPYAAAELLERSHWTTASNGIFELNLYFLFQKSNQKVPPWTGEAIRLEDNLKEEIPPLRLMQVGAQRNWRRKTWFLPAHPRQWTVGRLDYREVNASGNRVGEQEMEFASLKKQSPHLISLLPVKRINGRIWVGLMQIDSPAPQAFKQPSKMWSLPVLRLPPTATSLRSGVEGLKAEFHRRYSAEIASLQSLGSSYRAESEFNADLIHPFVAEVKDETETRLKWYPLNILIRQTDELQDERLLLSLFRLAHADGTFR